MLHGSYQADLASRHAFADLAALRGLPPGEASDRREVIIVKCWVCPQNLECERYILVIWGHRM